MRMRSVYNPEVNCTTCSTFLGRVLWLRHAADHNPAALGYRMPADTATWLSWPRREGISFPDAYDRVLPTFREMVAALLASEPVCINVSNGAYEAEARAALEGLPQRGPARELRKFLLANTAVLVPTFADPNDARAVAMVQAAFPKRRVVAINCRELIWGLGAFHCLTQQQPR